MTKRVIRDPRALDAGWQARPRVGDENRGPKRRHPVRAKAITDGKVIGESGSRLNQRLKALDLANAVRIERGQVRRRLHELELDFDEFLDAPPACCLDVPLVKVLAWLPNIGHTLAQRIVGTIPMEADLGVRVCDLTPRAKYFVSERVHARVEVYARVWQAA